MDRTFKTLDAYSLGVVSIIMGYARLFRDTPVLVIIGAMLLPLLALRWALPYWAFMAFSAVVLVAFAWLTIRFIAAYIDHM